MRILASVSLIVRSLSNMAIYVPVVEHAFFATYLVMSSIPSMVLSLCLITFGSVVRASCTIVAIRILSTVRLVLRLLFMNCRGILNLVPPMRNLIGRLVLSSCVLILVRVV